MMIEGIGIDLVDVARFKATLERTPAVGKRLLPNESWPVIN